MTLIYSISQEAMIPQLMESPDNPNWLPMPKKSFEGFILSYRALSENGQRLKNIHYKVNSIMEWGIIAQSENLQLW